MPLFPHLVKRGVFLSLLVCEELRLHLSDAFSPGSSTRAVRDAERKELNDEKDNRFALPVFRASIDCFCGIYAGRFASARGRGQAGS
jgi:hypothetical protein